MGFDLTQSFTDLWIWILFSGSSVCITLINYGLWQRKTKPPPTREEDSPESFAQYDGLFDEVERNYDLRVLKFDIKSTTSWFELGLRDSRKMTLQEPDTTKGEIRSLKLGADLAGQYFHIDHSESPKLETRITATFQVYDADFVIVFLRKPNKGELTVQILDEEGEEIGEPYRYANYKYPRNHVEFGRNFT
jgi:hypothetical protein